tara:strand:- start:18 stop:392 length:375 start_codon:yes stop_codon:yes gene_type:complete
MNILAYTYMAAYHCITCSYKEFGVEITSKIDSFGNSSMAMIGKHILDEEPHAILDLDENDIPIDQVDDEGSSVHPVFDFDDWMELDPNHIAENPTQWLACDDCHKILDTYKVIESNGQQFVFRR